MSGSGRKRSGLSISRAARLRPESTHHETHFWLAQALFGVGDGRRAMQHLELARQHSPTLREQALYAAKLDRLRAQHLQ